MKLKNHQLPEVLRIFGILSSESQVSITLRWRAGELRKTLEGLVKTLGEAEVTLIKGYALIAEDGSLVPVPDKNGRPIPNSWQWAGIPVPPEKLPENPSPEQQAAFDAALPVYQAGLQALRARQKEFQAQHAELMGIEHDLAFKPFPLADYEKSKLTGDDLQTISWAIAFPAE